MAIVTLPNGAQYNTGTPYIEQPDSGSFEFGSAVEFANNPTKTFISGSNPNLPRIKTQTWTETSYDNYNYIRVTSYNYAGSSYTKQFVTETFQIESK
jgi:hypothetical protein